MKLLIKILQKWDVVIGNFLIFNFSIYLCKNIIFKSTKEYAYLDKNNDVEKNYDLSLENNYNLYLEKKDDKVNID